MIDKCLLPPYLIMYTLLELLKVLHRALVIGEEVTIGALQKVN